MGGRMNQGGDVDWYVMQGEIKGSYYLIDIEAQSMGAPVDSYICLYNYDGVELACNDDTDTLDSMLFYNIEIEEYYYLMVMNLNGNGGNAYKYQVLISSPLLISAAAGGLGTGNVAGIPFQSGDILAWSNFGAGQEKWVMLFDLSDLNVKGNVVNLAAGSQNSDTLLLGFAANASLPGITGTVTPWEVVAFDPWRIGPTTRGTFLRWWNGKQQGLTLSAEKPDAIDYPLRVSTTGTAKVPGGGVTLKLFDEDVGLWNGSNGQWALDFDGSKAEWGIGAKDVIAQSHTSYYWYWGGSLAITPDMPNGGGADEYYLVLQGTASLVNPGSGQVINVNQKDIIEFGSVDYPAYWISVKWHGPDHGWNYNIDAIELSRP
jgi:hypothetical protein